MSSHSVNMRPDTVAKIVSLWGFLASWANSVVFVLCTDPVAFVSV